jgi:hypothetical protein
VQKGNELVNQTKFGVSKHDEYIDSGIFEIRIYQPRKVGHHIARCRV